MSLLRSLITERWAIIHFLRSLAAQGQAILCTIHQPSRSSSKLSTGYFPAQGGQTCYFGDLGANANTLIQYFETNGARECQEDENPAECVCPRLSQGPLMKQHCRYA